MKNWKRGLVALVVASGISFGAVVPAQAYGSYYVAGTCENTTTYTTYKWYKYKTTTRCDYRMALGFTVPNVVLGSYYWGYRW